MSGGKIENVKRISRSVEETERIASELAQALAPGAVLALEGELGAGKTQFVRGLVMGLGGEPRIVSSPTFVLLNVYQTPRMPVYHLDAYRVSGGEDFEAIGFEELLEQQGIVVVEWPSRVESILPAKRITIHLTSTGRNSREIEIEGC